MFESLNRALNFKACDASLAKYHEHMFISHDYMLYFIACSMHLSKYHGEVSILHRDIVLYEKRHQGALSRRPPFWRPPTKSSGAVSQSKASILEASDSKASILEASDSKASILEASRTGGGGNQ